MNRFRAAIGCAFVTVAAHAASFGPLPNGVWVDTPRGRFECQIEKGGIQVLTLDGKVLYRGYEPDVLEDGPISEGFRAGDLAGVGCFDVVDNRRGYLIIARAIAPPWYGRHDIAVIDFNVSPPTIAELVEGDTPSAKSEAGPLLWKTDGFSLRYRGLPLGVEPESMGAPKPALHELWFDFGTRKISQIK